MSHKNTWKNASKNLGKNLTKTYQTLRAKSWLKFPALDQPFLQVFPLFDAKFQLRFLFAGIPVGLVLGLFSYLFTNKVKLASNVAMGSYLLVSAGYFANCRLEFNKKVSQNKELGDIMNLIIKYRGTELEEQFQKKYKEKLEEIDSKSKYV